MWGTNERLRKEGDLTDLLIPKLNQAFLILHNLIALVHTLLEQLGQSKPLPSHLIPIIRIHKLVIVHAIRRIPLDSLDRRLT